MYNFYGNNKLRLKINGRKQSDKLIRSIYDASDFSGLSTKTIGDDVCVSIGAKSTAVATWVTLEGRQDFIGRVLEGALRVVS